MSATHRSAVRKAHDFYPTPGWCVDRLLDEMGYMLPFWDDDAVWLEPCAGDGAIVYAVDAWAERNGYASPRWVLNDIEPRMPGVDVYSFDYTLPESSFKRFAPSVAITNPPFSLAGEVLGGMLEDASEVLLYQRLNWLASEQRAGWWRNLVPSVYVLPNRPSHTGDGKTDAIEYAWFHFSRYPEYRGRLRVLEPTPKDVRKGSAR